MSDPAIRIALVTLGVEDLSRASAFYEAMGLKLSRASQETIHFYDMDGVVLALFPNELLAEDAGVGAEGHGFRGQTLAWNVVDAAAVDAAFARVLAAGASSLKPPYKTAWGGYVGHFADPDGHLWEVAHNPFFPLHPSGAVSVPPPREGVKK
jgi:catechol 2,3-dioxygenase-like lactoylglutathione lyase family enzyme